MRFRPRNRNEKGTKMIFFSSSNSNRTHKFGLRSPSMAFILHIRHISLTFANHLNHLRRDSAGWLVHRGHCGVVSYHIFGIGMFLIFNGACTLHNIAIIKWNGKCKNCLTLWRVAWACMRVCCILQMHFVCYDDVVCLCTKYNWHNSSYCCEQRRIDTKTQTRRPAAKSLQPPPPTPPPLPNGAFMRRLDFQISNFMRWTREAYQREWGCDIVRHFKKNAGSFDVVDRVHLCCICILLASAHLVHAVIWSEKVHIVLSGKYGRSQIVHFIVHTHTQYIATMWRFAGFRSQMKIDREILCQYCQAATDEIGAMGWTMIGQFHCIQNLHFANCIAANSGAGTCIMHLCEWVCCMRSIFTHAGGCAHSGIRIGP